MIDNERDKQIMKVLVVVDFQNDFVTGSLANPAAQEITKPLADYIRLRSKNDPIVLTRDTHFEDYLETFEGKNLPIEHCLIGTPGWCIVDEVYRAARNSEHTYVDKTTFGYLNWREVFNNLQHGETAVEEITICGVVTDICVISNALILRATYPKAKINVLSNLCAGLTPEKHAAALEVMKSCQIDVI